MGKYSKFAGALFGMALFAAAGFILHRELRHYSYHEVAAQFKAIPDRRLALACLLTALNYLILTGYDFLAFRYIGNKLRYIKIAFASFIAYAYSNNIGMAALSGGSIRYRFYTAWGLSSVEVAQVISFGIVTFWLGLLCAGALGFISSPPPVPASLGLPFSSALPVGLLFALAAAAYLAAAYFRKAPLTFRGFSLNLPRPGLALAQAALSATDWLLAAGVLYCLLPPEPGFGYVRFLAVFMLAQVAGLLSQVPGGLGVFETVIVLAAGGELGGAGVLGALVAYRAVYYLLPLAAASLLIVAHGAQQRAGWLRKGAWFWGRFAPGFVPQVMAMLTFAGGLVLLFSGATPAAGGRLAMLGDLLPLGAIEASHFLASLGGAALIILARGLQRRLDASYHAALVLLLAGAAFSLAKGFDYEEALLLSFMAAALWSCRRSFYRKASLLAESFSPGWVLAVAVAIGASVWLGLFSYKHLEYSGDLWWRFELLHSAPRFMRASVGAVSLALIFALAKLFRPAKPAPGAPGPEEIDKARAIAAAAPATEGYLALLGDKRLLFSDSGRAFIMYAVQGASWIAMGDPVGEPKERAELIWKFRELCDRHGGRPVFYEVGAEGLPQYVDVGLSLMKLGEEGRVPLASFTLEGGANSGLRHAVNRPEKEGASFAIVPQAGVAALLPELKAISDAWLKDKNTREKGFSLGFFREDYIGSLPCAVALKGGRPVAFTNVWPGGGKKELSTDLMRFGPDAPKGVMDYLFIKLMLWGKEEGYGYFNLGMAPLSGLPEHALAPLWNKLGAFLFRQGEHFYNFQGLRAYKEKFGPVWTPRYLASPGGLALPGVLLDAAALISGGVKGVVSK